MATFHSPMGGFTSECAIYFCKSLSAKVMFSVSLSLSSPASPPPFALASVATKYSKLEFVHYSGLINCDILTAITQNRYRYRFVFCETLLSPTCRYKYNPIPPPQPIRKWQKVSAAKCPEQPYASSSWWYTSSVADPVQSASLRRIRIAIFAEIQMR